MRSHVLRKATFVCVLSLLALAAAGCVSITALDVGSGSPAGHDYTVTVRLVATEDAGENARATLAVRRPAGWRVASATYSGTHSATLTNSMGIEAYFGSVWEDAPLDATHTGEKPGYAWYAGYTEAGQIEAGDTVDVTVVFDTGGVEGGTYSLDFVAGLTSAGAPDDPSRNFDGQSWEAGGLTTPPAGIRLDVPVMLVDRQTFLDVPPSHPYWRAVEYIAAAGIINGYDVSGGKEFRPDADVWRWQFAKMMCGTMGIEVDESMTTTFSDLGPDSPTSLEPHDYVAAASWQIIRGYSDNTFRPYAPVSRAQAVTMAVRGYQTMVGDFSYPGADYRGTLGDFSPEHSANMRMAEYNGLTLGLQGFGADWDPWQEMSRGEVAQVLSAVRFRVIGPHGG